MKHVGILGGTFDIVHNGHVAVAAFVATYFGLDKVVFVTSGQPPHKLFNVLDSELRHELVQAALEEHPQFEASRIELDRPGFSYTHMTVTELKAFYTAQAGEEVKISFILSAEYLDPENASNFTTWEETDLLLQNADLIIVPRGRYTAARARQWAAQLGLTNVHFVDEAVSTLSSGVVRDALKQGLPIDSIVPARVAELVKQRGLCYR